MPDKVRGALGLINPSQDLPDAPQPQPDKKEKFTPPASPLMHPPRPADKLDKSLGIADALTRALDAVSTTRMINRGDRELVLPNAIAKHPAAMAAYSSGVWGAEQLAANLLRKHGHPLLAKMIPTADIAYDLPLGIKNLTLPDENKRKTPTQPTPTGWNPLETKK